jgi:glycosyltransferase involved in cell wall biosynthesis
MSKLERVVEMFMPRRVLGLSTVKGEEIRGRVLLSYVARPITWKPGDRRFRGHTNRWECAEIGKIFLRMGYTVDAIAWDDLTFEPKHDYDAVFDIHMNLGRLAGGCRVKLMHVTGSDLRFSNDALAGRLQSVYERRGVRLLARREMPQEQIEAFERNCSMADVISLIGNELTRSTFPSTIRDRIRLVPVTGSYLSARRDPSCAEFKKEFLWFGGSGAVHKGLDLVLDVFSQLPELTLHVIGPYEQESDFAATYARELHGMPNVRSHGYLDPSSRKFIDITRNVIGHVFPSCSEGISPAAVTCMQFGFLPILSANTGIDVSANMGRILHKCSLEEIKEAVVDVALLSRSEIVNAISLSQQYALDQFSQRRFSETMTMHIRQAMGFEVDR